MKTNLNHPTFLLFLDTIITNILTNIKVDNYFSLTKEKKTPIQYLTLKIISQLIKVRIKLTNEDLLEFINILIKKNEDSEQYELAGILIDVVNNFESLNEKIIDVKKVKRTIKVDKTTNE